MRAGTGVWIVAATLMAVAACGDEDVDRNPGTGGAGGTGTAVGTGGTSTGGTGGSATGTATGTASGGSGSSFTCADPDPAWLLCEDFEAGDGDFDSWFAASDFIEGPGTDDRGRVTLSSDHHRSGSWAAYYPAAASSGYRGGGLDWWHCDGAQQSNCPLINHDTLYFRAWVRFAPDHRYIHHFLSIGGSQADDYWYHGTAGCMPNGELHMGTTVESGTDDHHSYFYTYFPGMNCDTNCGNYADVASICAECANKGLPTCDTVQQCCWGNHFGPEPDHFYPVDQWFCLEMMMQANTPGSSDGEMAYWVDGVEIHRETGMMWRTVAELGLNRVRLQHYITEGDADGHSNRVWFDDVVVSDQYIGCD